MRLYAASLSLHRELTRQGEDGIAFADGALTQGEALGTFTWLGTDGGRDARVRSVVSGREGQLYRGLLRRA